MGFLSDDEVAKLSPAESLFPSPIPVQFVSSDEFMPGVQTAQQREFEARVKAHRREARQAARHDPPRVLQDLRRHGGGVRRDERDLRARCTAPLYDVRRARHEPRRRAGARRFAEEPVRDGHAHALPARRHADQGFVAQREAVGKAGWNPALVGKPQTIDDLKFPNYFKEIFLDSDTKVACISGSYSVDPKFSFLTNEMKFDAREKINKEAGTRRMFSHAIFTPGWEGWLDKVDQENEKLRPDSWKGYTIGDNTNKHLSKFPFRLDDEKLMYPFYEKLVKAMAQVPGPPGPEERLHPQGPVPAVGRGAVPASGRLLQRQRRRQGGEGLAAAQLRHLPLGVPLGRRPRRHRRERVGPAAARPAASTGSPTSPTFPAQFGVKQRLRGPRPDLRPQQHGRAARVRVHAGRDDQGHGRRPRGAGAPTRCGPARRNGRSRRCAASRSPRRSRRSTASRRWAPPTAR